MSRGCEAEILATLRGEKSIPTRFAHKFPRWLLYPGDPATYRFNWWGQNCVSTGLWKHLPPKIRTSGIEWLARHARGPDLVALIDVDDAVAKGFRSGMLTDADPPDVLLALVAASLDGASQDASIRTDIRVSLRKVVVQLRLHVMGL